MTWMIPRLATRSSGRRSATPTAPSPAATASCCPTAPSRSCTTRPTTSATERALRRRGRRRGTAPRRLPPSGRSRRPPESRCRRRRPSSGCRRPPRRPSPPTSCDGRAPQGGALQAVALLGFAHARKPTIRLPQIGLANLYPGICSLYVNKTNGTKYRLFSILSS